MEHSFDVGGVRLAQPFRIRRLGHFGFNVNDPIRALQFYRDLLGMKISDPLDFGPRLKEEDRKGVGHTQGYFMRHGTEHHAFVLFPKKVMDVLNPHYKTCPENTSNQITWQVGSLKEVLDGHEWFLSTGRKVLRAGRDIPGSNWHFYPPDPDGHVNELFYGIEQVGWSGHAKPRTLHATRYEKPPALPHHSEEQEVNRALSEGVGVEQGYRHVETLPETYDVEGILLARPFKVVKMGPVRLFVNDVAKSLAFYQNDLGLRLTETIEYQGHTCAFLRANTEHHAIALYPKTLRDTLGMSPHTTTFSFGFQLASYTQLKQAVQFLREHDVQLKTLPAALFPGMGPSILALDPDGHAIQLYHTMEQIGWEGRPRPASMRQAFDQDNWPAVWEGEPDSYGGEVFLGPWN